MTNKTENKKDALLEEALKQIEKQYGKGSIMRLGDRANVEVDALRQRFIVDRLLRWESAVIRKAESLRSTDRNPAVKQH